LGFGLVGLDRWIIAPLFPSMMKDLHLNYQDLGNLVGILGVCWGVFAAVMGGVSDKIGRRKVLIPAIFIFSILSGLSGMATGFLSLILIRGIMGRTGDRSAPQALPRPMRPRSPTGVDSIREFSRALSRFSASAWDRLSPRNY
jgi:MFS family permease